MTLFKHKRRLAAFTLLFSVLMGTAVFASNVGTVTRDSINVRSGDSNTSEIIGVTNTGDSFAILDVEPGWVKVQYPNSSEAYIASLYVKVSEADASVVNHAVNVRSGPSTSTEVIGQLNTGETISVIGKTEDNSWYKVNYFDKTAYVSADYLGGNYLYLVQTDKKPEQTAPAAEPTAETVAPEAVSEELQPTETVIPQTIETTVTETEAELSVSAESAADETVVEETTEETTENIDEILSTFTPAPDNTYAVVNAPGGLRLRSLPSSSVDSTILTVLSDGYAVTVLEQGDGWLYVSDDYSNEGYVSSDYVEISEGTKPENSDHIVFDPDHLTGNAAEIAEYSLQFVGTPYVYGGTDLETGVDCSGFVYSVYKNFGITLQRNSASMYTQGTYVDKSELQAGDLVFFNTGGNTNISHVGMYLGDNMYIHSSTYSTGVIVEDLYDNYSTSTYVGAKRIIN